MRPFEAPFVLRVPARPSERHGHVDLYPADGDGPCAAVILVHGGPIPPELTPTPRDWPSFAGYGRAIAERGVLAAVPDHRLYDLSDYAASTRDIDAAIDLVRADPRVDPQRIALWCFSGGGPHLADWLTRGPAWLRCVAATYPLLDAVPDRAVDPRLRPIEVVAAAGTDTPPIVLCRVGLEDPDLAEAVERFVVAAHASGATLDIVDVPHGHHGFEARDNSDESRTAIIHSIDAVLAHLGPDPLPRPTPSTRTASADR